MHSGMTYDELDELHYITPIANLSSILEHGILCHRLAAKLKHESVADEEVQDRRRGRRVPLGRPLHEYVNLYINARNPMMYRRQGHHRDLCVLRVDPAVVRLADVVVCDGNAAGAMPRFGPGDVGLSNVDKSLVYSEYWTHPDEIEQRRHKLAMCAEVLVPRCLATEHIRGAYASCRESKGTIQANWPGLSVVVNGKIFFR